MSGSFEVLEILFYISGLYMYVYLINTVWLVMQEITQPLVIMCK